MNPPKDTKLLGYAGLILMLLGLASLLLVYVHGDPTAQSVQLAAGTGVLWALGLSTAATAGIKRLEALVAELEKALAARS